MKESDPTLLSLEATLERNFPGLEVLDRDLELSARFRADLVAMEQSGRLVLVILVEGDGDDPVLASVEALAFAAHNAAVLPAHFEEPRLRTDQPPRVLLVAQTFPEALVARLRPLFDSSVELFEVRNVKSSRGDNVFLTAVGGEPQVLAASGTATEASFLLRLAPDQESIARHAIDRMARIDEALLLAGSGSRLTWSFRGVDLARVEMIGNRLHGTVAPGHEARALRSKAQVDYFVEEVLGRYVSCLGIESATAPEPVSNIELIEKRAEPEPEPDSIAFSDAGNLTLDELRAFQE
ncbi:MAG: hypothetical protein ACI8TQ_000031 [Planctomycetota bacterium]|jgi:hypothetical protein